MSATPRHSFLVVVALLAALLVAPLVVLPPAAAAAGEIVTTVSPGLTGLTPARLLDTRTGVGAPAGRVAAGGEIALKVTGIGGVPTSGVAAVVLNVTVVDPLAVGYVTAYPAGVPLPVASNVNFVGGQTVANAVVVRVGAGGVVRLFTSARTQLVADVSGWYADGSDLTGVTPARLLDTRSGVGAAPGRVAGGGEVALRVTDVGGVPASGVSAVVLNVTVTEPVGLGFLTAYPGGVARPEASNLNYVAGATVANAVVAKVGGDGVVRLFVSASAHVLVDVSGWYADGADLTGVTPDRLLDTRSGIGAPAGRVGPGREVELKVTGVGGVPEYGVAAVVLNVTVVDPVAVGYVTAYPAGVALPVASNVNFVGGQTVANAVVVKVGAGGVVRLFASAGAHLLADVTGFVDEPIRTTLEVPDDTEIVPAADVVEVEPPSAVGSLQAVTLKGLPTGAAVGSTLYVAPTTGSPVGAVGEITSVSGLNPVGVTLRVVPLSDAFPSGTITGTSRVAGDGGALQPGAIGPEQRAGTPQAAQDSCTGGLLRPTVTGGISARVDVDVSWSPFTRKHVRIVSVLSGDWTVDVDFGVGFSCSWTGPTLRLPPVGPFVPIIAPVFSFEGQGSLVLSRLVTLDAEAGVDWWEGENPQWVRSGQAGWGGTAPTVGARGQLVVEAGLELGVLLFGGPGLTITPRGFLDFQADSRADPWWQWEWGMRVKGSLVLDLFVTRLRHELADLEFVRRPGGTANGAFSGPTISVGQVPSGTVGQAYSYAVPVTGGAAPIALRVASGSLPPGLAVSGARIVGTPMSAGRFSIFLAAVDNRSMSSERVPMTFVVGRAQGDPPPTAGNPTNFSRGLGDWSDAYGPLLRPDGSIGLCSSQTSYASATVRRDGSDGPWLDNSCGLGTAPRAMPDGGLLAVRWLGGPTRLDVVDPDGTVRWSHLSVDAAWPTADGAAVLVSLGIHSDRVGLLDASTGDLLWSRVYRLGDGSPSWAVGDADTVMFLGEYGQAVWLDRSTGVVVRAASMDNTFMRGSRPAEDSDLIGVDMDVTSDGGWASPACTGRLLKDDVSGRVWEVPVEMPGTHCQVWTSGTTDGGAVLLMANTTTHYPTHVWWVSRDGAIQETSVLRGPWPQQLSVDGTGRLVLGYDVPVTCGEDSGLATCTAVTVRVIDRGGAVLASSTIAEARGSVSVTGVRAGLGQAFAVVFRTTPEGRTAEVSSIVIPFMVGDHTDLVGYR